MSEGTGCAEFQFAFLPHGVPGRITLRTCQSRDYIRTAKSAASLEIQSGVSQSQRSVRLIRSWLEHDTVNRRSLRDKLQVVAILCNMTSSVPRVKLSCAKISTTS
jgi:hypothetical protein